jgi:energy-coupling factor transporter ATP-binding protein EcfA2
MIIAGPSGCGKTSLLATILKKIHSVVEPNPVHVIFVYSRMQALYDNIQKESSLPVTFTEEIPSETQRNSLLIIDDLQGNHTDLIRDWFTKNSHHYLTSVIYLVQNIFDKHPAHRTISLNTHYIIVFKNPRDGSQITHLAKQMFPENHRVLVTAYRQATNRPHGYLLIDLCQSTPDHFRLRDSVFKDSHVFVDKNLGRPYTDFIHQHEDHNLTP